MKGENNDLERTRTWVAELRAMVWTLIRAQTGVSRWAFAAAAPAEKGNLHTPEIVGFHAISCPPFRYSLSRPCQQMQNEQAH